MKKLFLYVFLGLLFCNAAQAEESFFICKSIKGGKHEFVLIIDKQKKKMIQETYTYEIWKEDKIEIFGKKEAGDDLYELIFNKFTGHLLFATYNNKLKDWKRNVVQYYCKKAKPVV